MSLADGGTRLGFDHLLMEILPYQHRVHTSQSHSSAPNPWTALQGLSVSAATLGDPTALLLLSAACGFPSRSPASRLSVSYRNRHLGAAGGPALTFPAQDEPTCPFVVALRNIIGSGNVLSVLCANVSVFSNGLLQQKLEKTIHISVL